MKAIRKQERKYGSIGVEEVPLPTCTENEVTVRIKTASVCGSDIHAYTFSPTHHYINTPITMGHECAGEVIEVGSNVEDFVPGDPVVVEAILYCGKCSSCMQGNTHLCNEFEVRGMKMDGVFTEQIVTKPKYLHKVPRELSFEQACLVEPLAVAIHAVVDNCDVTPGELVLISGPGPVGILTACVVRSMGAIPVITGLSDDEKARSPLLRKNGFHAVNVEKEQMTTYLQHHFKTDKVGVVIECSGSTLALQSSLQVLQKGGVVTLVGLYSRPAQIDLTHLVRSEISIRSSCAYKWNNFRQAINLLATKKLELSDLITLYSIHEAEKAFEDAIRKKVVKPVFRF
ncbi:zinc-dependent alcohol dehydrogenase [Bacillus sp. FJAT-44742]|uniref:zinc-dependent alcohol dehydrogenase n=1 Tax=Bacillus sp. FJAT-44742 TaxID=2014005 RepID=UPI000C249B82|nr:alcohol dehydrogenase catalytic domain-containing protein [Bacillus sp. FJAT-44742]